MDSLNYDITLKGRLITLNLTADLICNEKGIINCITNYKTGRYLGFDSEYNMIELWVAKGIAMAVITWHEDDYEAKEYRINDEGHVIWKEFRLEGLMPSDE